MFGTLFIRIFNFNPRVTKIKLHHNNNCIIITIIRQYDAIVKTTNVKYVLKLLDQHKLGVHTKNFIIKLRKLIFS